MLSRPLILAVEAILLLVTPVRGMLVVVFLLRFQELRSVQLARFN
jgi:hypothetical protein